MKVAMKVQYEEGQSWKSQKQSNLELLVSRVMNGENLQFWHSTFLHMIIRSQFCNSVLSRFYDICEMKQTDIGEEDISFYWLTSIVFRRYRTLSDRRTLLPSDRLSKRPLHFHWIRDASNGTHEMNLQGIIIAYFAHFRQMEKDWLTIIAMQSNLLVLLKLFSDASLHSFS